MGGAEPASLGEFARQILTTPAGHQMIVVGNTVGFVFALLVLVISVVSFPMLVDRDVSAGTAVRTSVRAVAANPLTMAIWGLFVALALVVGSLPLFFGLAVVFPVLGHANLAPLPPDGERRRGYLRRPASPIVDGAQLVAWAGKAATRRRSTSSVPASRRPSARAGRKCI